MTIVENRIRAQAATAALRSLCIRARVWPDDRDDMAAVPLSALERLIEIAQTPRTVAGPDIDEAGFDALGAHQDDRFTEECAVCGGWTPGTPLSERMLCTRCERVAA